MLPVRSTAALSLTALLAASASPATADAVRFDTVFGAFDVDLFEEETPGHVANFLAYVDAGDYDDSIIHRSADSADGGDFVVQGGAFTFDGEAVASPFELDEIVSRGEVINEPGISNQRGTIALARVGGQENSGDSQFFFNLQDNSFLDDVDGGFTVFGETDAAGLSILDQIAAVPTFAAAAPFGELPLRDFAFVDGEDPSLGADELVLINSISRLDDMTPDGPDPTDPTEPDGTDGGDMDDDDAPAPADPGDPVAVPTPGAAVAGLFGLGAVLARRRRA